MKWVAVLLFVALAIDGLPALDLGHRLGTSRGTGNKKTSRSIGLGVGDSKEDGVTLKKTVSQEENSREHNQQNSNSRTAAQSQDGSSNSQTESERFRSDDIERDRRQEDSQSLNLGGKKGLVQGQQTSKRSDNENRETKEYNKDSFSSRDQNGGNTRSVDSVNESGNQHQTRRSTNDESSRSFGLGKGGLTKSQSGSKSSSNNDSNQGFKRNQQSEEDLLNSGGNQDAGQNNIKKKLGSHSSPIKLQRPSVHPIWHTPISHIPSQGNSESHLYNPNHHQKSNYGSDNIYENYSGNYGGRYTGNLGNHNGRYTNAVWNNAQNNEQLLRGGHQRHNHFFGGTSFQGANPAEYFNQNHGIDTSRSFFGNGYQTSDMNNDYRRVLHQGQNQAISSIGTENQGTDGAYINQGTGYRGSDLNEDFSEILNQGLDKVHFVSGSDDQATNSGEYVSESGADGTGYHSPDQDFSEVFRQGSNKPYFISEIGNQGIHSGNYINGISPRNGYSSNDYLNGLRNHARGAVHPGNANPRNYINEGYLQGSPSNTGQYPFKDETVDANSQYIRNILAQRFLKHGAGPNGYGVTPAHHHTSPIKRGSVYADSNQGNRFYDTVTGSYMANPSSSTDHDDGYEDVAPGYIVPAVITPEAYPNGRVYKPSSYRNGGFGSGFSYIPSTDGSRPTTIFGRGPGFSAGPVIPIDTIPISNDKTGLLIDRTLTVAPLAPLTPLETLTPLSPVTPPDNENEGTSGDASGASDIIIDRDALLKYDTTYGFDDYSRKVGSTIDKDLFIIHGIRHPKIDNEDTSGNINDGLIGKTMKKHVRYNGEIENTSTKTTTATGNNENTLITTKTTTAIGNNEKTLITDKEDDRSTNKDGKPIVIDNKNIEINYNHGTDEDKKDQTVEQIYNVDGSTEINKSADKDGKDKSKTVEDIKKGLGKNDASDNKDTDKTTKNTKPIVTENTKEIKNIDRDRKDKGKKDKTIEEINKSTNDHGSDYIGTTTTEIKKVSGNNDKSGTVDSQDDKTTNNYKTDEKPKTVKDTENTLETNDKSESTDNNDGKTLKNGKPIVTDTVIRKQDNVGKDKNDKTVEENENGSETTDKSKPIGNNSDDTTKTGETIVIEKPIKYSDKDEKVKSIEKIKSFLTKDDRLDGIDKNVQKSTKPVGLEKDVRSNSTDNEDANKNNKPVVTKKITVDENTEKHEKGKKNDTVDKNKNILGTDDKSGVTDNSNDGNNKPVKSIVDKATPIKKAGGSEVTGKDDYDTTKNDKLTIVKTYLGKNMSNFNGNDDEETRKTSIIKKTTVINKDDRSNVDVNDTNGKSVENTYKGVNDNDTQAKTVKKIEKDNGSNVNGNDDNGTMNSIVLKKIAEIQTTYKDASGKEIHSLEIKKNTERGDISRLEDRDELDAVNTEKDKKSKSKNINIIAGSKDDTKDENVKKNKKVEGDENDNQPSDEDCNDDDVNDVDDDDVDSKSGKGGKSGSNGKIINETVNKKVVSPKNEDDSSKKDRDENDEKPSDEDCNDDDVDDVDDDDVDRKSGKGRKSESNGKKIDETVIKKVVSPKNEDGSSKYDRDENDDGTSKSDKRKPTRVGDKKHEITKDIGTVVRQREQTNSEKTSQYDNIIDQKDKSKNVDDSSEENCDDDYDLLEESRKGALSNSEDRNYQDIEINRSGKDKTPKNDDKKHKTSNFVVLREPTNDRETESEVSGKTVQNDNKDGKTDWSDNGNDSSDEDCDDDDDQSKKYENERGSENGDSSGIEFRNENGDGNNREKKRDIDTTSIGQKNDKVSDSANSKIDAIFKNDKSSFVGKASQGEIKEDEDEEDWLNYYDENDKSEKPRKSESSDGKTYNESSNENCDDDDDGDEHDLSDKSGEANKSGNNGNKKNKKGIESENDDGCNNVNREDNGDGNSESSKDNKSVRNGNTKSNLDTKVGTILGQKKDSGFNSTNGSDKNDQDGIKYSEKGDFVNNAESRNDADSKETKDKKVEGTETSVVSSNGNRDDNKTNKLGEDAKSGRKQHKIGRKGQKYNNSKESEDSVNNETSIGGKSTGDRRKNYGNPDVIGKTWRARNNRHRSKVGSKHVTKTENDLESEKAGDSGFENYGGENSANSKSNNLFKNTAFRDHKHKTRTLRIKEQKNDEKYVKTNDSKKVVPENANRDEDNYKTKSFSSGLENEGAKTVKRKTHTKFNKAKNDFDKSDNIRTKSKWVNEKTNKNESNDKTNRKHLPKNVNGPGQEIYNDEIREDVESAINEKPPKTNNDKYRDANSHSNKGKTSKETKKHAVSVSDKDGSTRDANANKDTSNEKDTVSGFKNNSAEGRDNGSKDASEYGNDTISSSGNDDDVNKQSLTRKEKHKTLAKIVKASQQRKDNDDSDDVIDKKTMKINDSTEKSTRTVIENISNNGSGDDDDGSDQCSKSNTKNDKATKNTTDKSNDAKQQKDTTYGTENDDDVSKKSPVTFYTNAGTKTNHRTDSTSKNRISKKSKLANIKITIKQHKSENFNLPSDNDDDHNVAGTKTTTDSTSGKITGSNDELGKAQDNNGAENCDGETSTSKNKETSSQSNDESKEVSASSTVNKNNERSDSHSKDDKNSNSYKRTEESAQLSSGDGSSSAKENLKKEGNKTYYEKKTEDKDHFEQQEVSKFKEEKTDSKRETVRSGKSNASEVADQSSFKNYTEESNGKGNKKSKNESASIDDKKNQTSSSSESKTVDSNGNTKESKSSSTETKTVSSKQYSSIEEESRSS